MPFTLEMQFLQDDSCTRRLHTTSSTRSTKLYEHIARHCKYRFTSAAVTEGEVETVCETAASDLPADAPRFDNTLHADGAQARSKCQCRRR